MIIINAFEMHLDIVYKAKTNCFSWKKQKNFLLAGSFPLEQKKNLGEFSMHNNLLYF